MQEYKLAAQLDPGDPRPPFNLAVIYQDEGRTGEAVELYRSILDRHPRYAPALANLASIEEGGGDFQSAERTYRRAMEVNPDDAAAAGQYGFFLLRRDRVGDAEAAFLEALRRNKKYPNAFFGLAVIARQQGKPTEALRFFKEAIYYNPQDLEAHLQAADILLMQGKKEEAVGMLKAACSLDPARGDTFLRLGRLQEEQGAWKDAEEAMLTALKQGAPSAECNRELARIYEKLAEQATASAGE